MKKVYYQKLDYLRLSACVLVFLYHLGILKGGYLAVNSFFVLSGYLAVGSLQKKNVSLKDYYAGRLKDIYLPLLVVTLITIALVTVSGKTWINLKPETVSVLAACNNCWQIRADLDYFTRPSDSPFLHMWYIAILLQFYIVFPFIYKGLKLASRKISRLLPYLLLVIVASGSFIYFSVLLKNGQIMKAYYGSFARCFALFTGVLWAFVHQRHAPSVIQNRRVAEPVFYIYLAIMFVLSCTISAENMKWAMPGTCLITVRMIDYALSDVSVKRPDPWICLFARVSYEIYLFQYPMIYLFKDLPLPGIIKDILIIISTIVMAFIVYEALTPRRSKQSVRPVLAGIILMMSVYGAYVFFTAKDYTQEIAELQNKLEENEKLMEEKNEENKTSQEEENSVPDNLSDEEAVREMLSRMRVTGIGDSLMVDIAADLYEYFPNGYFDGEISRHQYDGIAIMKELRAEGELSDTIILMLATNGDYVESYNVDMMDIAQGRQVFWVNAVGAYEPMFNEWFAQFAADYDSLHIIDWERVARDHPEYFYYDGIHVMEEGTKALADLIYDEVYNYYLQQYRKEKMAGSHRELC